VFLGADQLTFEPSLEYFLPGLRQAGGDDGTVSRRDGVIDTMESPGSSFGPEVRGMARPMASDAKRPRISIDVVPEVRRRLRLAAAKRDLTIRQYVLEAIEERLREDLGEEGEGLLGLTSKADPVLAELWDNPKDAQYDRLSQG